MELSRSYYQKPINICNKSTELNHSLKDIIHSYNTILKVDCILLIVENNGGVELTIYGCEDEEIFRHNLDFIPEEICNSNQTDLQNFAEQVGTVLLLNITVKSTGCTGKVKCWLY